MADVPVHLRPFRDSDLELLSREATDPAFSLPYEWAGYRSPEAFRRRWEEDGFLDKDPHQLVVADGDDTALGWVVWRDAMLFSRNGWAWEIASSLRPTSRSRSRYYGTTPARRVSVRHHARAPPVRLHRIGQRGRAEVTREVRIPPRGTVTPGRLSGRRLAGCGYLRTPQARRRPHQRLMSGARCACRLTSR